MQTYEYRKHIKIIKYVLPPILGAAGGALVFVGLWNHFDLADLFIGGFLIAEAVVIWVLFTRMSKVSVSIAEHALIYNHSKGVLEIPFEKIQQLQFPSLKYLGGWVKVVSETKPIRLTVVIKRIDLLILELMRTFEQHDLTDRCDLKKLRSFYQTAAYCEQSWDRVYVFFWPMLIGGAVLLCVGGGIGYFVSTGARQILYAVLYSQLSVLYGLLVYLTTEVIFMFRLRKQTKIEPLKPLTRELGFEKKVYTWTLCLGGIVYALCCVFILITH